MKDVYRACASVLVFQKDQNPPKILLLHKPRKKDSWQIPQGGVEDGETYEEAALRELKEESGLVGKLIGKSETVYQYDFPSSYRKVRPDNVCGQRIEFCFAVVEASAEVLVDQSEINSFAWATKGEIGNYIKRKEYLRLVKKLVDEGEKLLGS